MEVTITKAEEEKRPRRIVVKQPKVVRDKKKIPEPDGRNILIVGKKKGAEAEEKIKDWLATPPGFIEGYASDEFDGPLNLYSYQAQVMYDRSFFIHGDKARQIGWSYGNACEATAKGHLQKPYTSIFISINQEEANEKIVFARAVFDSFPLDVKKKCVVDNKKSLEFEDADGDRRSRTRLISHAQREPRGKGGNTDVYLDESAHYIYGERIYTAALPIITRGSGRLVTGSTPLGKRGIHYTIKTERKYMGRYSYYSIYWWNCPELVKEGTFKKAQKKAPLMSTEERVLTFGSDKLVGIFVSMALDNFQQEYELKVVDELISYFPLDLIHPCCYEIDLDPVFAEEDDDTAKIEDLFSISKSYPKVQFKLYESLDALALAVQKGKVSGNLFAGYDVGRKKHNAEFAVIEEIKELQIVRYLESFPKIEYYKQEAYLKNFMATFLRAKLGIDAGGIGNQMSENVWIKFRQRTDQIEFSNKWKETIAGDIHIRLESETLALPYIKRLVDQFHSIKRKVTEHGHFKFDAEKNPEHHGDVFWAIALASSMGTKPAKVLYSGISSPLVKGPRVTTIPGGRVISSPMIRNVKVDTSNAPLIPEKFNIHGVR